MACELPIVGDAWNYWLLARTDRDDANARAVGETAVRVMRKWFRSVDLVPGAGQAKGPAIDSVEVLSVAQLTFPKAPRGWAAGSAVKLLADWRSCPTSQSVSIRRAPWSVFLRFVPRSSDLAIPWPVYTEGGPFLSTDTTGADWLLIRAWYTRQETPEERRLFDELGDVAEEKKNTLAWLAGGALLTAIISYTFFKAKPWR